MQSFALARRFVPCSFIIIIKETAMYKWTSLFIQLTILSEDNSNCNTDTDALKENYFGYNKPESRFPSMINYLIYSLGFFLYSVL